MPAAKKSIDREIGELSTRVTILTTEFNDERVEASQHRQSLKQTISTLSESVRVLTQQIAVNETKLQSEAKIKRFFVTTILGLSTVAGAIINELWKYLTHVVK